MFLNTTSITKNANGREIIFWGCSEDWIPKSKKLLPSVKKICDIQKEKIGDDWEGLQVLSPKEILDKEFFYVVITSGSLESIEEQLIENNFKAGIDYSFSPVFEDFKTLEAFNNDSIDLIFTSSDYPISGKQRSSRKGGGIYTAQIRGDKFNFDKKVEGSFRQIVSFENNFYAIDYFNNSLRIFDMDLNELKKQELSSRHCTGISVNEDYIFVLSSADDVIIRIDRATMVEKEKIPFGPKSNNGLGCYHINDCWLDEKNLFFTYFSKSGLWRNEIFDGGISVLDIETNEIKEIKSNLYQPHSPIVHENEFYFCESTEGKLFRGTHTQLFSTNAFLRGITFHKDKIIFGQSETLYLKRLRDRPFLMVNSGIFLFDEKSKLTRFFPTLGLKNIHQIIAA